MNILNLVLLPEKLLEDFRKEYPDITLYNAAGKEEIERYLTKAEVIFGNCPAALLPQAKNLRWIQIVSSGIDAYQSMADSPVIVTTAKGVHWRPIAEYLLTMMLVFSKNHRLFQQKQAAKLWYRKPEELALLSGQKLGIIGFGGIAHTLVEFVRPFRMEITAVDKYPPVTVPDGVKAVHGLDSLETLLSEVDHIVLALPLAPETRSFLNATRIAHIKAGAFFYNVSRGELVDEQALIQQLKASKLGGVALDVFDTEPLPPDSPLWEMDNVIVTPHLAGHYKGLREATFHLFRENLNRYRQDKPLKNRADFEKGY